MSHSTTRISELHETNSASFNMPTTTQHIANEFYGSVAAQPEQNTSTSIESSETQNYRPLNIHPNPYGHNEITPETMPMPEASPQRGQQPNSAAMVPEQSAIPGQINYTLEDMPQQRLPSRDIPMNSIEYQQDEEIQANHVPKVKLTSDYIREYEAGNEKARKEYRENKYREETAHGLISDLQLPILVALLYFIFQMPVINTLLRKYFSFLTIYHDDGNFNFMGLLLKSIMFGSIFYTFHVVSVKISNL
jgi:hypothetical protein